MNAAPQRATPPRTAPSPSPSPRESLLARKRRVLMPGVGHFFGDDPVHLVRGRGARVWDADGNEFLDVFCGVGVTSLGHNHPEVTAAAARQLGTLQHTSTIHLTGPMIDVAERLVAIAPTGLSRVFFCADGSGANEGAMLAARLATGRPAFLAVEGSLHGRTALTQAVTGIPMWRSDPFEAAPVTLLGALAGRAPEDAVAELRAAIEAGGPDHFAAFIVEPIQGNGGIVVPAPGVLAAMQRVLREHGILLIADEVQTGLCRTGRWFGIEQHGVEPDLMTVAKALANGLPAAAWLCTEAVAQACATTAMASTFGGNLVAMVAARTTIDIMVRDRLAARAEELGARLGASLDSALARAGRPPDVRGAGLMLGVPMRDAEGAPDRMLASRVLDGMRRRGVLAGLSGIARHVIVFMPPLTIDEGDLERAVRVFERALTHDVETSP